MFPDSFAPSRAASPEIRQARMVQRRVKRSKEQDRQKARPLKERPKQHLMDGIVPICQTERLKQAKLMKAVEPWEQF
jgi:hypothetical protein